MIQGLGTGERKSRERERERDIGNQDIVPKKLSFECLAEKKKNNIQNALQKGIYQSRAFKQLKTNK